MSDMDPLYQLMQSSAQDMSEASVTQKTMMSADEDTDVDIPGYGLKPSYSKQIKILFTGKSESIFRLYPSLEVAQSDIANTPEGRTTYVRSPDGSALADEYINNGGTLVATGRRMPSQVYIDSRLTVIQQIQEQSLYRDSVAGFSFPVISADKRVIGFKNDGGVYVADVEIPGTDK
ncbi:hypothetical protein Q6302_26260, partial [Klebsiella pneumoniae]|nr:hypothetical protein [Klebsiella pneumoniae]